MTTFEMYGDPHEWPEHLGGGRRWKDAQGSAQNSGAVDLGADSTGSEAIATALLPLRAGHMDVSQALEVLITFKRIRRP